MAGFLRVEYEGAICRVIARGNNRGKRFFVEADYREFGMRDENSHFKA